MSHTEQGFTLVELLVAMLISSVLLTATLAVVNSNRRLYDTDSRRIDINQNLRSALLVVSNDVRQAGERVGSAFPAIETTQDTTDTITLRRSLLDVILPVCKDINASSARDVVFVAKDSGSTTVPEACKLPDPANLETWKTYRVAQGGQVPAFIYDPVKKRGEFFIYDAEDSSGQTIHRQNGTAWTYSYDLVNNPQVYVLEQRQYKLSSGTLVMIENGGAEQAVAPNLTALNISVRLKNGSSVASNFPTSTLTWKDVAHIEVSLTGAIAAQGRTTTRTLSETVTPRNAFSADN